MKDGCLVGDVKDGCLVGEWMRGMCNICTTDAHTCTLRYYMYGL